MNYGPRSAMFNRTAFLLSLDPSLKDFATPRSTEELVPWTYYNRQTFSAGALAVSTAFFGSVPTDSRSGNMELAAQVPSPKRMLVAQIRVHAVSILNVATYAATSVAGTITNDVNLFQADTQVDFSLGDKKYLRVPTWKLPSGGGLTGFTGANIADVVASVSTNGWPRVRNGYDGAWPIPCNTSFTVSLLAPGANTIANDMVVTIALDGWLIRPKQ